MKMPIDVFSYSSDIAGSCPGAAEGPEVIHTSGLLNDLTQLHWHSPLKPWHHGRGKAALNEVERLCHELAALSNKAVLQGNSFLTLGGDHSCAIGTWSGVAAALQPKGPIGLIWFDAHMDSHTHETTPSNNIHGMPLASLLGHGVPPLTELYLPIHKLLPQHVTIIGARSFEPEEEALLKRLNVRVYKMKEIHERGLKAVMQEAILQVTRDTVGFGLSIDLDGIDPIDAPGVSVPEPAGVSGKNLIDVLPLIKNTPHFLGAEVVEFNPRLDHDQKTLDLAAEIIKALFKT